MKQYIHKKVNMTLKNLAFSLCLLSSGGVLVSCGEDFLDRLPTDNYVPGTYYTSDEAVVKSVEPLYNYAWHGYQERAILGIGSFRANDAWSPYLRGEFARFTITGLHDDVLGTMFWDEEKRELIISPFVITNIVFNHYSNFSGKSRKLL